MLPWVAVRVLHDVTADDLGMALVPWPVELGDEIAVADHSWPGTEHGLEGVVAKKRNGIYRPGYRGWTKIKNPSYWRRAMEVELIQRRRRVATTVA